MKSLSLKLVIHILGVGPQLFIHGLPFHLPRAAVKTSTVGCVMELFPTSLPTTTLHMVFLSPYPRRSSAEIVTDSRDIQTMVSRPSLCPLSSNSNT